ncbi:MAG: hypothetical protein MJE68_19200 [Proteobacteria bacterium]|nr:hypothetical protein [Pseudomonadota bacterium]
MSPNLRYPSSQSALPILPPPPLGDLVEKQTAGQPPCRFFFIYHWRHCTGLCRGWLLGEFAETRRVIAYTRRFC